MVFHIWDFYSTTLTAISRAYTFLHSPFIDPYFHGFVSPSLDHSHHRYFIAPRRVVYTQHLCRAFVSYVCAVSRCYGKFPPTSPSFWPSNFHSNASRSIRGSVSGRYPVIPLLGLSVVTFAFRKSPAFL